MARNILALTTLLALCVQVYSNSYGAPASACKSMTPSHGSSPQQGPSPYSVQVDKDKVKGGETVEVTLVTTGAPFIGFLAMGSKVGTDTMAAGNMSPPVGGEGPEIQTVKCPSGLGITHTENQPKFTATFQWKAPLEGGKYVILATFVQRYDTFWIKIASPAIEVLGPDAPKPQPELASPSGPSAEVVAKWEYYYKNCKSTKGCFGIPDGCISTKNCEMFSSWRVEGTNYRFQIAGKIPGDQPQEGHVSMGLSYDKSMGQDSVVGCVYKDAEGAQPKSSYNTPTGKSNKGFANPTVGLLERTGVQIDGWVFCDFSRTPYFKEAELEKPFDLSKDSFHILMARSASVGKFRLGNTTREILGDHNVPGEVNAGLSGESVLMTDMKILGAKSSLLIQLHGAVMVVAWIMTSSLGIFVARYYKQTHTDFNPFNKAFWFVLHVGSMFLTIGLTFLGVIFIFVEIGGYSSHISTEAGKAHPILGLILTGICCLQLTIGLLRPHPGTANRPIFNWVHWTAGNVGHIVGIACIFLATELPKSGVQNSLPWLITVIVFVVFHVLMHGTLSIHTVWADKQMNTSNRLRGMSMGPMKPSKGEEAPGTGLRTFLLLLYICGILAVGIKLIVDIAVATNA